MPSSPSRASIFEKSALPTPTIIIETGNFDRLTIASFVYGMSVIAPSVRISSIWYFGDLSYVWTILAKEFSSGDMFVGPDSVIYPIVF